MRISIFDYQTVRTNAIGNCNWMIVNGLHEEHDFTVFSLNFENPDPERVTFVRVPVPPRPLFLLFVAYHVIVQPMIWLRRLRGQPVGHIQTIGPNLLTGSIVHMHFCHRVYLRDHWRASRPGGLRGVARWLDHVLQSLLEPLALRRAKYIIVPSNGLARELEEVYPRAVKGKIHVIPNPVNAERMKVPPDFDRGAARSGHNFSDDDMVMVFVAAGHFERKGLPLLLEAMHMVDDPHIKLMVVGGQPGVLQQYKARARALGLENQVRFAGFQKDIRPYLWAADLFAFPSTYETFSLVAFEAAAAGLPVLSSHLHGVEEMLVEGENGWCVERKADALADRIRYALEHREELKAMGQRAAESVTDYDEESYVARWRALYLDYQASNK